MRATRPSSTRSKPFANNRPPPVQNLLLATLPQTDLNRITPALQIVPLKLKNILHKPGEPLRAVYFPGGGFCSMVTVLNDGSMVEVATIWREGSIGFAAVLVNPRVTYAVILQG